MDIKEYRYILEIANAGGVTKAAANLHISQPSLSEYLRNIEYKLGLKLFVISHDSVVPTAAGEIYVEHARQILGLDHMMMDNLIGLKERRVGKVRIGIPGTPSSILIPLLMKNLKEKFPKVEIKFVEAISSELEDMALNRSLDFIFASKPFNDPRLESRLLFEEHVIVALHKSLCDGLHPVIRESFHFPHLEASELEGIPFTLLKPGQKLRKIADSYFLEHGIVPNVIHETGSSTTALNMVKAGLCGMFGYDSYVMSRFFSKDIRMFSVGSEDITLQFVAAYLPSALNVGPAKDVLEEVVRIVHSASGKIVI